MGAASFLKSEKISQNISTIKTYCEELKVDAFYISSFDQFLNEYVPLEECHRYYFSGFTGSVAEVLVLPQGKVRLYVDGRYYEQADLETNPEELEVCKVPASTTLASMLCEDVKDLGIKTIACEAERTSAAMFDRLNAIAKVRPLFAGELASQVEFNKSVSQNEITLLSDDMAGGKVENKLARIFADANMNEAYFLAALEDIAWVSNARGYQLPFQSAFMGKALVTKQKVHIFLQPNSKYATSLTKHSHIRVYEVDHQSFSKILDQIIREEKLDTIFYDKSSLNLFDLEMIKKVGGQKLIEKAGGLIPFHSIKTKEEITILEDAFDRSNKAIFNTVNWAYGRMSENSFSELELSDECLQSYKNEGSTELTFKTIAAIAANSSIIHYSNPSAEVKAQKNDLVLLDSGSYYGPGFATDTTRTFLADPKVEASPKQKEIYTLVLKGLLRAQNAIFPDGIWGSAIDAIARLPITQYGYNYGHGTGHGIGINVHSGGVRISPLSVNPMREGQVASIEPGIYIPGFGGVRLENIVLVEKHPDFEGMLRFRNLVWVGFDPRLINLDLLNVEEKKWLAEFEAECKKRGNSFN